ncbi:MAG TPA: galactokinase [Acidobacteriaceae bacterium]|nr:galactokinase [Acidobacteriaceae bacterium]
MSARSIQEIHSMHFGAQGTAYQAPGRVNLIGEHTDTSEGFVMPAALDLRTLSVLSPRRDSTANIYSVNFDEQASLDLQHLPSHRRVHWSDYPTSVLWTLEQRGIRPEGFDLTLSGNVPLGSGLSSSASVEVAVAIAVLAHAGMTLTKPEIAKICQFSENNFVGAQSGIMDPFTSCCGVDNHALLIDCRSLDYEALPLPSEVLLVICNSMVKHSLAGGGEYNARRAEVQAGVKIIQKHYPDIHTLRDVTEEQLRRCESDMPEEIFRRCLHVVTEDERVLEAAAALRSGDFHKFGGIMHDAHISMRDNYAASCMETDLLVELAARQPGCFGARITGGGFGGCTINLVAADHADDFVHSLRAGYEEATGIRAEIYLSRASDGAGPLLP